MMKKSPLDDYSFLMTVGEILHYSIAILFPTAKKKARPFSPDYLSTTLSETARGTCMRISWRCVSGSSERVFP